MGQGVSSLQGFEASHIRIYKSILQIENPQVRIQMIQTVLQGPEYVQAAKSAGVYSHLLAYTASVRNGTQANPLPGELGKPPTPPPTKQTQLSVHTNAPSDPSTYVLKGKGNEKAMNYFQNCLLVLDLEEEVALTEDALRVAYKKAALKAHPDKKGGSEHKFEAVTRAYAYLTDILRRVQGGRTKAGVVEAPDTLKDSRATSANDWKMVEPVKLNPKKLDMNTFNTMFEQTRMPDPDDEGYGDWLKNEKEASQASKNFGGKFNRDVFNSAFEDEAKAHASTKNPLAVVAPKAMTLAPTHGVELGRGAQESYTAPANASMKYTDLKQAYTTENTFSGQVRNVQVDNRSFDTYSAQRKRAPDPLSNSEMEALQEAEQYSARQEQMRGVRAAQELQQSDEYFKRMKQLILMDTSGMTKKGDRYQ